MKRLREFIWYHILSKLPKRDILVSTKQGRLLISNHDQVIGRELYVNKSFELDKVMKVVNFFGTNKNTLLDVGANIGTVCIPLMLDKVFKKAFAFEPDEINFNLLEKNIEINKLKEKINPIKIALSDTTGTAFLEVSATNFGDHRLKKISQHKTTEKIVDVDMLDRQIVKHNINIEEIDLVWMDVQGHEFNVLKGAKSVLNKKIPFVIEFWPYGLSQAGVNQKEYFNFINNYFVGFYDLSLEKFEFKNISAFQDLFTIYTGESFTDLILLPYKP